MSPEEDEICKDCPYYFGKFDGCVLGEDGVPYDLERKCQVTQSLEITDKGVAYNGNKRNEVVWRQDLWSESI